MNRPQPAARGDFTKTPFAHLLVYGLEKKLTGSLELVAPDGRSGVLTLAAGFVKNAKTSEPVAHLGRVLVDLGLISDQLLNETLLEVAKTKRLHGEILLTRGAISEAQLAEALRVQVLRKVRHMLTLPPEAKFTFYAGFDLLQGFGAESPPADPLPVVWRAVLESPPWEHVHGTLSRMQNSRLRLIAGANVGRFELDKDVLELVERVRAQPMRVSEMMQLGVISPRVTQLLAYVLLITKQVEVSETVVATTPPPAVTRPSAPPPPANAASGTSRVADRTSGVGVVAGPTSTSSGRISSRDAVPPALRQSSGGMVSATPAVPKAAPLPTFGGSGSGSSGGRVPAPTPAAPELAPDLLLRRNEIRDRAATIDKQDYFEMLGIKRDAPPEDVQSAFFGLAKKWHPDRLPKELEVVRDDCARVFARLGEAHQTLMDAERRQRYMRLLVEGGATPDEQETIAAVVEATQNFQKAEIFLKRNDLAQAEILCRKAYEADRQQPDYLAMLAWLESMKPENQTPKATLERIAMLDRAVQLNDMCERAYFYRGMLHKRLQNAAPAVRDFRRAAELNPRNVDALREVRLFEMRRGKSSAPPPNSVSPPPMSQRAGGRTSIAPSDKGGGLLGKLFKK